MDRRHARHARAAQRRRRTHLADVRHRPDRCRSTAWRLSTNDTAGPWATWARFWPRATAAKPGKRSAAAASRAAFWASSAARARFRWSWSPGSRPTTAIWARSKFSTATTSKFASPASDRAAASPRGQRAGGRAARRHAPGDFRCGKSSLKLSAEQLVDDLEPGQRRPGARKARSARRGPHSHVAAQRGVHRGGRSARRRSAGARDQSDRAARGRAARPIRPSIPSKSPRPACSRGKCKRSTARCPPGQAGTTNVNTAQLAARLGRSIGELAAPARGVIAERVFRAAGQRRLSPAGRSHSAGSRASAISSAAFRSRPAARRAAPFDEVADAQSGHHAPRGAVAAQPASHPGAEPKRTIATAAFWPTSANRRKMHGTRPGRRSAVSTGRALLSPGPLGAGRRVFRPDRRALSQASAGRHGAGLAGAILRQQRSRLAQPRAAAASPRSKSRRERRAARPLARDRGRPTSSTASRASSWQRGAVRPAVASGARSRAAAAWCSACDETAARLDKAAGYAKQLEQLQPALFAEPTVRFPLAVAHRQQGLPRQAERFYLALRHSRPHDAWWACAQAELWLAEPKIRAAQGIWTCARAPASRGWTAGWTSRCGARPPMSSCAVRSATTPSGAPWRCWPTTTSFCTSASVARRPPGFEYAKSIEPRPRDADLADQDRVELLIDVDRDFATYYRLAIDHRGWTGESCWRDASWNPEWFVASGGDRRNVDRRSRDSAVGTDAANRPSAKRPGPSACSASCPASAFNRGPRRPSSEIVPEGFRVSDLPVAAGTAQRQQAARRTVRSRDDTAAARGSPATPWSARRRYRFENCVPLRAPRRP